MPPQCCLHPLSAPNAPTPVQASSDQEWYYCRSAWHFISLLVRLMFCQMYPLPITPTCPINAPRKRHLMAKSGTNLGLVDLSYCSIVCNRSTWVFEYFAIDCLHLSYVTPNAPWHPSPHPQYRQLVVKSGTSAGQHDISSACGSGWCLLRCTPSPTHSPTHTPSRGI